jgi:flavin-dependent dehydrogenase
MTTAPEARVFDAAVVGAGPAGSATALDLARRGWRVALIERTHFEQPRIGESLAPNVQEPLRALGVWPAFMALTPLPSWGTVSMWGDAVAQSHSHLHNPYGCGWHVDRRAFDRMLADAAVTAGAQVVEGVAVKRSSYRDGAWWLETVSRASPSDGERQPIVASVLIDATGRRAHVARALGAKRMLFDRLVGVAVQWAGVNAAEREHLLVETARDGWWYSAPLPQGAHKGCDAMIAMLMTDADLCAGLHLTDPDRWEDVLRSSQLTRRRLNGAHRISRPIVSCAHSQRLRRDGASTEGPWLAVGDATLAVDPISGSGVLRALRTAHAAADTVNEILLRSHATQNLLAAYEDARDKECTTYLLERAHYYAAEPRFDTPFWQRRQMLAQRATGTHQEALAIGA